jgi:hypothetical protein
MSYSFTAAGADSNELVKDANDKLVQIVEKQPTHAADAHHAQSQVAAAAHLLRPLKDGESLRARVQGSISATEEGTNGANLSVNVYIVGAARLASAAAPG